MKYGGGGGLGKDEAMQMLALSSSFTHIHEMTARVDLVTCCDEGVFLNERAHLMATI